MYKSWNEKMIKHSHAQEMNQGVETDCGAPKKRCQTIAKPYLNCRGLFEGEKTFLYHRLENILPMTASVQHS